tara:strand:- start:6476 stop:7186 length:711 start_codon:yes stop_codon:yes gene_type:complete
MAVDPNALPPYMRQVLQDSGIPNISLDPSERITVNVAPDEPAPVPITTQPYVPPTAQQQQPVSSSPMQGQPYQVGDLVGYEPSDTVPVSNNQPYVPQPKPQPKPEVVPVESTERSDLNNQLRELIDAVLTNKISRQEFEIRKEEILLRQKFDMERERLRAQTALEKKQIDENIARYQANALREAEVAKALTMVAYKANRPDAELVSAIMSPMSGLSSLYKAVGPVQGANIQLPRGN